MSASNLQYVLQAQKASKLGPASNVFSVTLGLGAGGGMVVASTSESDSSGVKMAA